jgi:transcriptional regulatory protein LevR
LYFIEFHKLCENFYVIVLNGEDEALKILGREFKAIGGMVIRMMQREQFFVEEIEEYFTLPSGDQDIHMLEMLIDVLTIRLEKKLNNKVICLLVVHL